MQQPRHGMMGEVHQRGESLNLQALPLSRDDGLLYLAALAVVGLGIWSVWFALESAALGLLLLGGVASGFAASLLLRRSREPLLASLLCLAGVLAMILLLRALGLEIIARVIPYWLMLGDPALAAAGGLGLVLVVVCFLLISREALIFPIVPVLAIFALLGTLLDPRVIIGYLLFLLASIFLLGYQHILSLREALGLRLPPAVARRLPYNQLLVSGGFFLTILLVALSVTALLMLALSRRNLQGLFEALGRISEVVPESTAESPARRLSPFETAGQQFRVGLGPITLGQEPVMEVQADSPALWRQRVYDLYTGNGWTIAAGPPPVLSRLQRGRALLGEVLADSPQHRTLKQTFHLAVPFREGIPAAAEPMQVDFSPTGGVAILVVDRFGCLVRANTILGPGSSYRVVSSITSPVSGAAENISLSSEERSRCLQFPWGARRVKELVAKMLPEGDEPAEKVNALVQYLQSGEYRYTLAARAVPADKDAADFFLFHSREGYCDLFSTALALMCRAAGIPSRLAVGFSEGEPDASRGVFIVKESDAHAWVEIFLEGRGWVTVDPTPPGQAAEEEKRMKAGGTAAWKRTLRRLRIPLAFLFLTVIVSAGLAKVLWFDPWWERRRWEKRMWATLRGRITVFYARMCRLLARRGLQREPWQTPLEYLGLLSRTEARLGEALAAAAELTRLFISSRYGAGEPVAASAALAENALLRLKRRLRRKRGVLLFGKKK